jgi:Short C-terminal domain
VFGGKKKKMEQAQRLLAEGARGVGTLIEVQDTGMTVNDNPRVKLVLSIQPLDGSAAFTGEKTAMVSRVRIPQVGARYPAFYDRNDPSVFMFVDGVSDEEGRRNIVSMFGDAFGPDAAGIGMPAVAASAPAAEPAFDPLAQLAKLGELHAGGVLTDEEFAAKKAELLKEV